MPTPPEAYRQAALERMGDARELKNLERYPFAMFAAGVGVECMLRSCRHRDLEHQAHHDVVQHFRACDAERLGEAARAKMRGPVETVHLLWLNNFRYSHEELLRKHLKRLKYHERVKLKKRSDILKVACIELMDAALVIVTVGDERWRNP